MNFSVLPPEINSIRIFAGAWHGAAAQAMTAAAAPYGEWLSTVTEQVEQAATQARTEYEEMWPADVTGCLALTPAY